MTERKIHLFKARLLADYYSEVNLKKPAVLEPIYVVKTEILAPAVPMT